MKLIPPVLLESNSHAEERVFNLLKKVDLGPGWVALHSLNLSEHHRFKLWSEIDFVLVGPAGIFVLEIKGGGVKCEEGVWYGIDRFGKVHRKRESPFEQSRDAMYALKRTLDDTPATEQLACPAFGWAVLFPDVAFRASGPEMPADVIGDCSDCHSPANLAKFIRRLHGYWRAKGRIPENRQFSPTGAAKVVALLRPNVDVAPRLSYVAGHVQRDLVSLTEEQYQKLDAIEESERIVCSGGAGTGKSFLALQTARREAAEGKSVLIVVAGEVFASHLARQGLPSSVRLLTHLELERELAMGTFAVADTLIVDEGQDLLNFDAFVTLGRAVTGGLEHGRWRWFMDHNNQRGITGDDDAEAEQLLRSLSTTPLRLRRNCRNTPEIVLQTQLTTGADIGEAVARGFGIAPQYQVVESPKECAYSLYQRLSAWRHEGILHEQIAILSPLDFATSAVQLLPADIKRDLVVASKLNGGVPSSGKLLFSTIRDFKGLERNFVCILDLFEPSLVQHELPLLYVGMTRANFGLWLAVSSTVKAAIDAAHVANVQRLAALKVTKS